MQLMLQKSGFKFTFQNHFSGTMCRNQLSIVMHESKEQKHWNTNVLNVTNENAAEHSFSEANSVSALKYISEFILF